MSSRNVGIGTTINTMIMMTPAGTANWLNRREFIVHPGSPVCGRPGLVLPSWLHVGRFIGRAGALLSITPKSIAEPTPNR
ncbi:hypothetical protein Aglo03_39820 [Actinokineospora globicatena]|uniref:Uncharacterized protein n=1 Tax=Actinokineospora globicatena TaxID=103729 RepID=A0A9W6QLI5_9PSEU|nr:hypothetical protein Aglo03_39820 [Actinokineospora globicatena]